MDINIDNELFTNRSVGTNSRLLLLPKILQIVTILVGVIVSVLITIDITGKIFQSYKEDSLRILSEDNSEHSVNFSFYRQENITEEMEKDYEEIQREVNERKELVENFYNKVDRKTYRGRWRSESKFNFLSEKKEGEMAFRIEKLVSSYATFDFEKAFIVFKLLDGHYIDKWTLVRAVNRPFQNVSFTNTTLNQKFSTFTDFGEIFEKVDYRDPDYATTSAVFDSSVSTYCRSTINLDWTAGNNFSYTYISHITGSFSSNCGFNNITFELNLEIEDEDFYKVLRYSIIVTLLAFSQIFNTIWLTYKISDSQTYANSISLFTVLQNIVWNAYGCLCHFFLTVNYDVYI